MLNKRNILILVGLIIIAGIGSYIVSDMLVPEKNPPHRYSGIIMGNEADKILNRVCFNCHSNETSWPWYTSLPMINLLISSDVGEARDYLNFSNWDSIPEDKRVLYLNMVFDKIERNEMPPMIYKLGHPEAKMTQEDLKILKDTASSLGISFNPK
ncbi:heme-binding domain-containing protein [Desulfobacter curvatus]|uniref:heme-binding domain-containing protein n=1 Tax=Desulfobacter curvatus TaxID=2290 RepID=UPI00037B1833|nr:heme-binding domain-containing protein [Desulfobacter curvatus]